MMCKIQHLKVKELQEDCGLGSAANVLNDSVATTLLEVIADEVMQQIKNTLKTIPEVSKEGIEQLFRSATL